MRFQPIPKLGEINISSLNELKSKTKINPMSSMTDVDRKEKNKLDEIARICHISIEFISKRIKFLDLNEPLLCDNIARTLFDELDTEPEEPVELNKYRKYFEEHICTVKLDNLLSLLKMSSNFDKYIAKFFNCVNVKDRLNLILDNTTDVESRYDVSKCHNLNTIVKISKQNFLDLSLETYLCDETIIKQFLIDLPRQTVSINGIAVKDLDTIIRIAGRYNRDILVGVDEMGNNVKRSLIMLLVTLICQSSFYMSFYHLFNKCAKMRENSALGTECNYHTSYEKDINCIDIIVDANVLKCCFSATYKIIDTVNESTIHIVKTQTLIDINNDTGLIVFDVKN